MQRNGQNPIRAAKTFEHGSKKVDAPVNTHTNTNSVAGICPSCKTAVPPKPGFRISALKCPKCGTPLGKNK